MRRRKQGLMKEPAPTPVPQQMSTGTPSSVPTATRTLACEAGLAALKSVDAEIETTTCILPSIVDTTLGSHRDAVDITTPFFRDILSDRPIPGADAIGSIGDWSERAERSEGDAAGGKKTTGDLTWSGEVDTLIF
ncbi:hypothetical protein B0H13DRAFT_1861399 [Mycena leptocephala]|nr:hypothetical protein B0H13DRAFT_1861399 [Mycena leptocephala]